MTTLELVGVPNTLRFIPEFCVNCGACSEVCPHGVFRAGERKAELIRPQACMECGACQRNCPTRAIQVDSGVGCASAMIRSILTGKEVQCGGDTKSSCC